ncbi:Protein cgi121 [Taphrina deformans PYCC 5710]|uniref:EKC/KEOPS complex subunit CGI121 n=1 Tax=Taphrina deformans (strain PYCC 5710 / ATCC 11124 / CBS 356.35 / IMI 108563 / JCM 9778 / NBRC 8474) TaxID=1097556 RepID=R4XBE3_TAPDE|nr:Protein cgi121 [Taphrina deformans PYCC 5710]|eukprot:CCG82920.1 Protein cgi121 [Taphrina deformans PYCC 5710]
MECTLPLFPNSKISIQLFSNVTNAATILAAIKSIDPNYNFCFLDVRRICCLEQLLYAVMRAMRDIQDGQARTKTVYSEIVYSLSPNQNITEALQRFGVAGDSRALVCIAIDNVFDSGLVQGESEEVTNENFAKLCDLAKLKSTYKIDKKLEDIEEIKAQIISSIALRGNL